MMAEEQWRLTTAQVISCGRLHLAGIALLLLTGCGGSGHSLVPVSGTVSLNGKPLPNARVVFTPVDGQTGPSSGGITDNQGHYQLVTFDQEKTGAVVGVHRVTVTTSISSGDDERDTMSKELVPPRYSGGSLRFDIPVEGTEEADFEMTTK